MIQAKINGKQHEFQTSVSILEAVQSLGADVPTLCNDERLKPCGACRLCLVEIKGWSHPVASCMNALKDGMEIETHTPALEKERKMNLRMLARKYPRESFEKFPEKHFHFF